MSGPRTPLIERAYQIADSGGASSTKAVRQMLLAEGYPFGEVAGALNGLGIRRALKARIGKVRNAEA